MLAIIVLAGCSSGSATGEPVEIRFSWWGSNDRNNATLAAVDIYNEMQDEVEIIPEYNDYASYDTKISTQLAGGSEACLMQIDNTWMDNYGTDKFVDLYDYADEIGLDNYSDEVLSTMEYDDGKLVGLPMGIHTPVFI
ncbi:MAG: ABC transporter substrate-binding protein, partial [Erysipelotrichaceae bacterium]